MSKIESLRAFVNERLIAAAEEICGAVEKTLAEFEESFIEHQKKKLNIVIKPGITILAEDVLVQNEGKEVTLLQGQENPELLQIKEEEEHIPTSQGVEESDNNIATFAVPPSPSVKSEKAILLQLSTETSTDVQDSEGPEPSADCRPLSSDCSEAESEDREDHENEIENGARSQSDLGELLKDEAKRCRRSLRSFEETEGSESDFETSELNKAVTVKRGSRSMKSREKSESQGCCDPCQCKVCGKSFRYKANLIKHASFHKNNQEFLCGICGERLDSSENLTRHLESHIKERKICPTCGKSCSTEALLKVHGRIHTGEKPYKCNVCPKNFTHRTACVRHIMAVHPEKMYCCRDCGKEFSDQRNLNEHMAAHRGKKLHRCDFCSKEFKYIGRLNVHKKVHTGDTPYNCGVCDRGFAHLSIFQRHIKAHSSQKPYICSICSKGFISSENLETHRRIHTGAKAYKCDVCPKKFISQINCKRHMRFHRQNL